MRYIYFVSYAHTTGWGNIQITSSEILDNMESIKNTQKIIEKNSTKFGIIIVSFQLLKIENADH